jgi:hypothetical protein
VLLRLSFPHRARQQLKFLLSAAEASDVGEPRVPPTINRHYWFLPVSVRMDVSLRTTSSVHCDMPVRNNVDTLLKRKCIFAYYWEKISTGHVNTRIIWEIITKILHIVRREIIVGIKEEKVYGHRYTVSKIQDFVHNVVISVVHISVTTITKVNHIGDELLKGDSTIVVDGS